MFVLKIGFLFLSKPNQLSIFLCVYSQLLTVFFLVEINIIVLKFSNFTTSSFFFSYTPWIRYVCCVIIVDNCGAILSDDIVKCFLYGFFFTTTVLPENVWTVVIRRVIRILYIMCKQLTLKTRITFSKQNYNFEKWKKKWHF